MSGKHPIIAVTGSSGAGTTTVRYTFSEIFRRTGLKAVFVEGASFSRYDRRAMEQAMQASIEAGRPITRFGPEANLFDELEQLFRDYSEHGTGRMRHYINDAEQAEFYGESTGGFTTWAAIPKGSDLLFYEGYHGGVVASTWARRRTSSAHQAQFPEHRGKGGKGVDVAQWVDLLIGVVPNVNLEWIQKIHRDCAKSGCSAEAVTATILRRMPDYVNFIVPQFAVTDINFQRVSLVDTSNPFIAREVPSADESFVVIKFRNAQNVDFPDLLRKIGGSFMSRPNTMVVPGGQMQYSMEVICTPIIQELMEAAASSAGARQ